MERKAGKVLGDDEIRAIKEFLAEYVDPFKPTMLKSPVLEKLIRESEVLVIESDNKPFTVQGAQFPEARKGAKVQDQKREEEGMLLLANANKDDPEAGLVDPNQVKAQINDSENALSVGNEIQENQQENSLEADEKVAETLLNPILYTRGLESDCFYLILSGKVMICSGNEEFRISQTSFNYMGMRALQNDDYRPDFSAKVIENARLLKVTRKQYR